MAEKPAETLASGEDAGGGAREGVPTPQDRVRVDALDAAAEFDATGRHATHEAVDDWLARLDAGDEAAPPTLCRREAVTPANPEWFAVGDKMRRSRVARQESLGDEARRLGVTPRQLGDIEHGRADPALLSGPPSDPASTTAGKAG